MTGAAVRSRLLELRRQRAAARRGQELLEQKREVLLREMLRRTRLRNEIRDRAGAELRSARLHLREAETELGRQTCASAALAQPAVASVERGTKALLGIALPTLRARFVPFRPRYGPGGTAESLDQAGRAFAEALPVLVRLAEEELAVRNLQRGFAQTVRRLNALEKVVLPRLDHEIRQVTSALEEEERDEGLRRKSWLAATGRSRHEPRRGERNLR
jgi:V/A-type H+/Na+-transporting ATPase subunit D